MLVYDHLDMSTEYAIEYEKDKNFDLSTINQVFWNFTSWDWNTPVNTVEGNNSTTSGFS